MTTIVWHGNRLYADSVFVKGRDRMICLDKIQKLSPPLPVTNEEDSNFNDVIVGWAASGAPLVTDAIIKFLKKHPFLNRITTLLNMVAEVNMVNADNNCTILLIGQKSNYTIETYLDACLFTPRPHTESIGMGTGGKGALESMKGGAFVYRAMLKEFLKDPELTGGIVDVWELDEKGRFMRLALYNERPLSEIPLHLIDMTAKMRPDMFSITDESMENVREDKKSSKKPAASTPPSNSPSTNSRKPVRRPGKVGSFLP